MLENLVDFRMLPYEAAVHLGVITDQLVAREVRLRVPPSEKPGRAVVSQGGFLGTIESAQPQPQLQRGVLDLGDPSSRRPLSHPEKPSHCIIALRSSLDVLPHGYGVLSSLARIPRSFDRRRSATG